MGVIPLPRDSVASQAAIASLRATASARTRVWPSSQRLTVASVRVRARCSSALTVIRVAGFDPGIGPVLLFRVSSPSRVLLLRDESACCSSKSLTWQQYLLATSNQSEPLPSSSEDSQLLSYDHEFQGTACYLPVRGQATAGWVLVILCARIMQGE